MLLDFYNLEVFMKKELINSIEQAMQKRLNNEQMQELHRVLEHELFNVEVSTQKDENIDKEENLLSLFPLSTILFVLFPLLLYTLNNSILTSLLIKS